MMSPEDQYKLEKIVAATDDAELQSELWIYLHDSYDQDVTSAIATVINNNRVEDLMSRSFSSLINKEIESHTTELIDSLPEIERSILVMMILSVPVNLAIKYKSLSNIRYAQLVASIASSSAWEIYVEKEAIARRASRAR
jgi:hypothetical protein